MKIQNTNVSYQLDSLHLLKYFYVRRIKTFA